MERDEFMNENFRRDFPELRKNIIKKKVSTQLVMNLLIYKFIARAKSKAPINKFII